MTFLSDWIGDVERGPSSISNSMSRVEALVRARRLDDKS